MKKLKLSPPKIEQFYDSIKSSINSKANKKSIRPIKQIEKQEKSTIFHFSLHKIKELWLLFHEFVSRFTFYFTVIVMDWYSGISLKRIRKGYRDWDGVLIFEEFSIPDFPVSFIYSSSIPSQIQFFTFDLFLSSRQPFEIRILSVKRHIQTLTVPLLL